MRIQSARLFTLALALAPLATTTAMARDNKWTCTKDGKDVKVKGDKADAKKKDCEAQGGTWDHAKPKSETHKAEEHKSEDMSAPKQSSGGGGSW